MLFPSVVCGIDSRKSQILLVFCRTAIGISAAASTGSGIWSVIILKKGWIPYNNNPQGISSLFIHRYTNTVFSRLYVPEWEGTDKAQAIYEVQDEHSLILSQVSRALFSNY